jgi:hypothetical protein
MTEVSFTGDLNYVTYLIEKYKKHGYVFKDGKEKKGTNPIIYQVVMQKQEIEAQEWRLQWVIPTYKDLQIEIYKKVDMPSLAEQLTEAVEREDYETAAILRDKINKK